MTMKDLHPFTNLYFITFKHTCTFWNYTSLRQRLACICTICSYKPYSHSNNIFQCMTSCHYEQQ
jgi:hypothetical protein